MVSAFVISFAGQNNGSISYRQTFNIIDSLLLSRLGFECNLVGNLEEGFLASGQKCYFARIISKFTLNDNVCCSDKKIIASFLNPCMLMN